MSYRMERFYLVIQIFKLIVYCLCRSCYLVSFYLACNPFTQSLWYKLLKFFCWMQLCTTMFAFQKNGLSSNLHTILSQNVWFILHSMLVLIKTLLYTINCWASGILKLVDILPAVWQTGNKKAIFVLREIDFLAF